MLARLHQSFAVNRRRAFEGGAQHSVAIGTANALRILRAVDRDGALTIAALMSATLLSEGSVRRGLAKLIREKKVESERARFAIVYRLKRTTEDTAAMTNDKPLAAARTKLTDVRAAHALAEEREQIVKLLEPSEETLALLERTLPSRVAFLMANKTSGAIAKAAKSALDAIDRELRAMNYEI